MKRIVTLSIIMLMMVSCSSMRRDPGDIVTIRMMTERELALGNREAGRGNFDLAHNVLRESKRRAILVDDISLMIRSGISLGNLLFTLGKTEQAFAEFDQAIALAQKHSKHELLSVSRIYKARAGLLSGRVSAQSVLDEVTREAANVRDRLFLAFSWQVRGLALRELRSFNDAELAVRNSLIIHERERNLENAAFDWHLIASIRSLSGNTAGALAALEASIALDRRTENSWGLAANWRATGDVHRRAGNTADALEAYQRARAIFVAMRNENETAEIDRRIESLSN